VTLTCRTSTFRAGRTAYWRNGFIFAANIRLVGASCASLRLLPLSRAGHCSNCGYSALQMAACGWRMPGCLLMGAFAIIAAGRDGDREVPLDRHGRPLWALLCWLLYLPSAFLLYFPHRLHAAVLGAHLLRLSLCSLPYLHCIRRLSEGGGVYFRMFADFVHGEHF